jgi:hypothetical protein
MALHRDIYWIGRQWTVTGFGVQAVDQRLNGVFDIEASQVWDDGLAARIRGQAWINERDFDTALTMARQRFPAPAEKSLPLVESVLELMQQPPCPPKTAPAMEPPLQASGARVQPAQPMTSAEPPAAPVPPLQLCMQGKLARFVPQWRVGLISTWLNSPAWRWKIPASDGCGSSAAGRVGWFQCRGGGDVAPARSRNPYGPCLFRKGGDARPPLRPGLALPVSPPVRAPPRWSKWPGICRS